MALRRLAPEIIPAFVNGLVVLFLPLARLLLVSFGPDPNTSVTVHTADWSPLLSVIRTFLGSTAPMVPLALIATWRTWVHARRWREGGRDGTAIAEAAICGVAVALAFALYGAAFGQSSPLVILPGILIVSVLGAVVGAALGLVLYIVAIVALTAAERTMNV
jgi:hypothetical protein